MTWSFPLAWGLLGLAPLIWWWHWRRRETPPVRVGSIELWTEDATAPTAGQPTAWRSWDAELWVKFFLLLLLTVAAAGPSFSTPNGGAPEGAALSFFALTRSPENPERLHWLAGVNRDGSGEEDLRVVLRHRGRVQDARGLAPEPVSEADGDSVTAWVGGSLEAGSEPGSPWTVSLENVRGRILARVSLSEPDFPQWRAILVGGGDGWFLEQAIAAVPGWKVERMDARSAVEELREQPRARREVIFVLEALPVEQIEALRQVAPLWFWSGGPGGRGKPLSLPVATQQKENHPLLRGIDFGWVTIVEAHEIVSMAGREEIEVLVESPEGGLLVAGEQREERTALRSGGEEDVRRRWLAVAFRLEDSDLALRPEFPVLIQQGLYWLRQRDTFAETSVWSMEADDPATRERGENKESGGRLMMFLLLGALLGLWSFLPAGFPGVGIDSLRRRNQKNAR